jgi:hypothetical protein
MCTFLPSVAQDAIYSGGAAYLVVSIALPKLVSMFEAENHLRDPSFWNTKHLSHTDPQIGDEIRAYGLAFVGELGRIDPGNSLSISSRLKERPISPVIQSRRKGEMDGSCDKVARAWIVSD